MRSRSRGRVALVERRDRVAAGGGVDDDGGEPERLVERAAAWCRRAGRARIGTSVRRDRQRAVADVDRLVADLLAPAPPAQLRHDADRAGERRATSADHARRSQPRPANAASDRRRRSARRPEQRAARARHTARVGAEPALRARVAHARSRGELRRTPRARARARTGTAACAPARRPRAAAAAGGCAGPRARSCSVSAARTAAEPSRVPRAARSFVASCRVKRSG